MLVISALLLIYHYERSADLELTQKWRKTFWKLPIPLVYWTGKNSFQKCHIWVSVFKSNEERIALCSLIDVTLTYHPSVLKNCTDLSPEFFTFTRGKFYDRKRLAGISKFVGCDGRFSCWTCRCTGEILWRNMRSAWFNNLSFNQIPWNFTYFQSVTERVLCLTNLFHHFPFFGVESSERAKIGMSGKDLLIFKKIFQVIICTIETCLIIFNKLNSTASTFFQDHDLVRFLVRDYVCVFS